MSDVRLIDANAFIEDLNDEAVNLFLNGLKGTPRDYKFLYDIVDRVGEQPTIDAAPVVHGRWVKAHGMMPPEDPHRKKCSMCGGWALQDYFGRERMSHYCPNCGAKMDGGAE